MAIPNKLYLPLNCVTNGATTVNGALEVLDSGATGHIVTQNGTAQLSTAQKKFGVSSFLVDGNSDWGSIPDHADWDLIGSSSQDYTVHFFVRHAAVGGSGTEGYIEQYEGDNDRWMIWHYDHAGDGLRFYASRNGGAGTIRIDTATQINDNNWHHLALVKLCSAGPTVKYGLFLDGNQIGYVSDANTDTFAGALNFGKYTYSGVNNYLNGNLAHLVIDKSNVLNATINADGTSGRLTVPTALITAGANTVLLLNMQTQDLSPAVNIPDFIGTAQLSTAQKVFAGDGTSLLLDGDSDYITLPDVSAYHFGTANFTMEIWAYITTDVNQAATFSKGYYTAGKNQNFCCQVSATKMWFWSYDGTSNEEGAASGTLTSLTNQWVHFAWVRQSNTITGYRNGVSVLTATVTKNLGNNTAPLNIGGDGSIATYFNGYFAHPAIWDSAIYTGAFTPPTAPYSSSTFVSFTGPMPVFSQTNLS